MNKLTLVALSALAVSSAFGQATMMGKDKSMMMKQAMPMKGESMDALMMGLTPAEKKTAVGMMKKMTPAEKAVAMKMMANCHMMGMKKD